MTPLGHTASANNHSEQAQQYSHARHDVAPQMNEGDGCRSHGVVHKSFAIDVAAVAAIAANIDATTTVARGVVTDTKMSGYGMLNCNSNSRHCRGTICGMA